MSEPDVRPWPDDGEGPEGAEGRVVDPTREVGRDGSTTRAEDGDAVPEAADPRAVTASRARQRGVVPAVAAVLLVVVGLVLVATGPSTAVLDFGYVAGREPWWQPVLLAAGQQVGAGLVVLGLVLGALAAGLRLGARRR